MNDNQERPVQNLWNAMRRAWQARQAQERLPYVPPRRDDEQED